MKIIIIKKILLCPPFLLCAGKTIDSHFVPIPTLIRDNFGIEPFHVGILTSPDIVRIPTLINKPYASGPF